MKTVLGIVAVIAMSISGYASAWTSTFFDKTHGGSFTQSGSDTPEEAQRIAFQKCREKASDSNCVELGSPKHGTTVVLAKGTKESRDDNIFIGADPDPERAANRVLGDCKKESRDCHLVLAAWDDGMKWSALALNQSDAVHFAYGASTQAEAEADAIRGCEKRASKKGTCRLQREYLKSTRVWFAFASSENDKGGLGLSSESEQRAKALALESCAESSGGNPCRVTDVAENPGPKSAPPSFEKLKARIERDEARRDVAVQKPTPKKVATAPAPGGEGNCRPRGDTLRCTSQCYNGNCIVTYENGCKVRVQVQPKFNPFNNQWDYPSPSC